jgi:hypothetical protein
MNDIDKMELILIDALNEYASKNKFSISSIEHGCFSEQHETGHGLTITLDNGSMFNLLILE